MTAPLPPAGDAARTVHGRGGISIEALGAMAFRAAERAARAPPPTPERPPRIAVRYLRRKPGRGLAVVCDVWRPGRPRASGPVPGRSISVTVGEPALAGTGAEHDLAVEPFPADRGLPSLAACLDPAPDTALWCALEAAARALLGDASLSLQGAAAEPIRYKPASRCVVRYALRLGRSSPAGQVARGLAVFGKVYAEPEKARAVHDATGRLYRAQAGSGPPDLPLPLGAVEELGLALSEAVDASEDGEPLRSGLRALRARAAVPERELGLAAAALARLHACPLRPAGLRPPQTEARRAEERAALLGGLHPAHAGRLRRLAGALAARLGAVDVPAYGPSHGGFKASQLLFARDRVFLVDFDGLCLADPALDVGYFLAYLRPGALWYDRPGARRWFESAAATFRDAYRRALARRGVTDVAAATVLARSPLYEAATLFKIATRRAHRLNSPRPGELSAMLAEIGACLEDAT